MKVPALAAEQGQRQVILSDSQGYTKGPFTAFMAPWNKGSLVAGVDYTESFALDLISFPANSQISWNWPAGGAKDSIHAFLAIDYGNYYNTIPETPIQSSRIYDLKSLVCKHDLSITGAISGFNIIINFFLTSTSNFGTILFEIEVFLHIPNFTKAYVDSVSSIGTFTSASGSTWNVGKDPVGIQGPDILFYPSEQADLLAETIDLKEMLFWLMTRKVITGDEFFNGLAVGVEPQQKNGTLTVNNISIEYQS